jgi:hypothetical protein
LDRREAAAELQAFRTERRDDAVIMLDAVRRWTGIGGNDGDRIGSGFFAPKQAFHSLKHLAAPIPRWI